MSTSTKPVVSLMNFLFTHVLPPSVVLKSPRSRLGRHAAPRAATHAVFGSVGCTITRPMCSVSLRPMKVHVRPPSTDLKTPPPGEIELRELGSPVPR